MRYLRVVLALAAVVALASACWGPVVLIPAHTERLHAAMSLPAIAADGTLWVANGHLLLHLNPDGGTLGVGELPVQPVTQTQDFGLRPRLYANSDGSIFVYFTDGRVGMLTASGQMAWTNDLATYESYATPCADGLLVYGGPVGDLGTSFVDTQGQVRWRVPGTFQSITSFGVDEHGRAYFIVDTGVRVMDADGTEALLKHLDEGDFAEELLGAVDDRALVRSSRYALCFDTQGHDLWRLPSYGSDWALTGAVLLSADRAVLSVSYFDQPGYHYEVRFVNGNGQEVRNARIDPGYFLWANKTSFLWQSWSQASDAPLLTLYSSDGAELWHYVMPKRYSSGRIESGQLEQVYTSWGPEVGTDGRIYFEENSTLYCLSMQGHLLWQLAGSVYYDVWVEAMPGGM